jgi:carboxypeptidase family protein
MVRRGWFAPATGLAVVLLSASGPRPVSQVSGPGREPSRGTGAISGIVSEGTLGRPLPGVVVSLLDGSTRVSVGTVTDSKGRFVFRGLRSSDGYVMNATKPGFVGSGLVRAFVLMDVVRIPLAEGEWISDVRVTMWRLGAVSGRVVDENGEPVVDVPVRVLERIPVAGTAQFAAGPAAKTDDRGIYRIAGLGRGNYIVTVPSVQSTVPAATPAARLAGLSSGMIAPGGGQTRKIAGLEMTRSWLVIGNYATPPPSTARHAPAYPVLFYTSARTLAEANPVSLLDGEEKRNVDFTLQPVPTASISGRIIGPGDVVARLVVRLLPKGSETLGAGFEQATALVSSDGTFDFVGIPAGEYTVDATPTLRQLAGGTAAPSPVPVSLPSTPGLIREAGPVVRTIRSAPPGTFLVSENTKTEPYSGRLDVTVGSSDLEDLIVPLQVGGTISGRIVREDGAGLSGRMSIRAEPANGDPRLAESSDPAIGPSGAFAITGLQPGEYFLRAGLVKSITAPDGDHTDRPFDTSSGRDITDVVVTITDRPGTLSGVVRDGRGTPVRDGAVIVFPTDSSLWTRFGFDPPRIKAVTFVGGRAYVIPRLLQGNYYVIALPLALRDAWHDPQFFAAASPLATRVTLDWGGATIQNLTIQQVTVK